MTRLQRLAHARRDRLAITTLRARERSVPFVDPGPDYEIHVARCSPVPDRYVEWTPGELAEAFGK